MVSVQAVGGCPWWSVSRLLAGVPGGQCPGCRRVSLVVSVQAVGGCPWWSVSRL